MTSSARVRIGRITPKAGNVTVLRSNLTEERRHVDGMVRNALDMHGDDIAGAAFVSWSADGSWMAEVANFDTSPVLRLELPDFVTRRPKHQVDEDMMIDRVRLMLDQD